MERRRTRRADVTAPVELRAAKAEQAEVRITGQVKNVGPGGLYCLVKAPCPIEAGDEIICSVSVPVEQQRAFPFTRVLGKGWVTRAESIQKGRRVGESASDPLCGLAVRFAPDVVMLGTV